jgi:hypothetical protein
MDEKISSPDRRDDQGPPGCNVKQSRNFMVGALALLAAAIVAYLLFKRFAG